jgi:hypothetical protein
MYGTYRAVTTGALHGTTAAVQMHVTYQLYKEAVTFHLITDHEGPGRRSTVLTLGEMCVK